jgi:hypothetical protein
MTLDYHAEAEAASERAERIDADFTACLRGTYRAKTEEGGEIGCYKAEYLAPEDKRE